MNNSGLGMVVARAENLFRLEKYGLGRAEFVVFAPEQRGELESFLGSHELLFSIHSPLYVPPDYPENPLLSSIIDYDEDRRRLAVGLMSDNVALAADMGAEFVVVHTQRPEQFAGVAPCHFCGRSAMDSAMRSLDELLAKSEDAKVPVLIENIMDNSGFYSAEQYLELLEKFPPLGFCLDVGHLDVDCRRFGMPLIDFVRALAPRTREVHLQNSSKPGECESPRPWKVPVHPSQSPDCGWVDIESVLREVLAASPDCVINFEFRAEKIHGHDFILEGMEWVRGLLRNL